MTADGDPPGAPASGRPAPSSDEVAVIRATFALLGRAVQPTTSQIAEHADLDTTAVDAVIADLSRAGRATVDRTGGVLGIAGLTREATRHRLVLAVGSLFTWCAYDAVGIPAALRLDAMALTRCPVCDQRLHVQLKRGEVSHPSRYVGWIPAIAACADTRAEFCPSANLFCGPEHLDSWRAGAGGPDGAKVDLDSLAELGRRPGAWGALWDPEGLEFPPRDWQPGGGNQAQ